MTRDDAAAAAIIDDGFGLKHAFGQTSSEDGPTLDEVLEGLPVRRLNQGLLQRVGRAGLVGNNATILIVEFGDTTKRFLVADLAKLKPTTVGAILAEMEGHDAFAEVDGFEDGEGEETSESAL